MKKILVWFFCIFTLPFSIISMVSYLIFNTDSIFVTFAKILSLIPGKIGNYIRTSYYICVLSECHYDLSVDFCSFFAHPNACVGKGVVIGSFTIIGSAKIDDNVLISSRVSILSGKFQHFVERNVISKHLNFADVSIGEGSWIGEGAIVMANIGSNSIVSSGSVVTKDMPDNMTAIGNPARFIKL